MAEPLSWLGSSFEHLQWFMLYDDSRLLDIRQAPQMSKNLETKYDSVV